MVKFKDECMKEGTVVHLRTQEQCNEFSKWLDSKGKTWNDNKSYIIKNYWCLHKEDTCYNPNTEGYSDRGFYANTGCRILSYEEALLEKKYSTPVIDPSKCKKYHVWDNDFGKTQNFIRYGVCIIGNRLHCVDSNWEQEFLNGEVPHLVKWKHWEEVKEDENKEVKEQISKLKAELEKLEGMINE